MKPFGRARFRSAMERVRRRFDEKTSRQPAQESAAQSAGTKEPLTRLFVRAKDSIVPLKIDDIVRFEADDDYVKVFVEKRFYLINQTLAEIESRLDASRFCRVHRSVIVNLEFVERVQMQDRRLLINLKDKTEILASRAGSQNLRKLIF